MFLKLFQLFKKNNLIKEQLKFLSLTILNAKLFI